MRNSNSNSKASLLKCIEETGITRNPNDYMLIQERTLPIAKTWTNEYLKKKRMSVDNKSLSPMKDNYNS
jgi:hypothetical protein